MYDTYFGLPNYFTTAYFWVTSVIAVFLGIYAATHLDGNK